MPDQELFDLAEVAGRIVLEPVLVRALHRESLRVLTSDFVGRTEKELDTASAEVEPQVSQSIIDFANAVNEEKASALVQAAERGLIGLQTNLSIAARTCYLHAACKVATEPNLRIIHHGRDLPRAA